MKLPIKAFYYESKNTDLRGVMIGEPIQDMECYNVILGHFYDSQSIEALVREVVLMQRGYPRLEEGEYDSADDIIEDLKKRGMI